MNITRTNIDELNAVIKLQVSKEDYEERVNAVLKDYRKKANVNGFRPGKVPMGIVKKMYGVPVLAEEVNKVLNENLFGYIEKEEIAIMGQPLPHEGDDDSKIDWEKDTEFEFSFDIAVRPEFTLNISKRDKLVKYDISVAEDMVNNQLNQTKMQLGETVECEKVTKDSLVYGDFTELGKEEGIVATDAPFLLSSLENEDNQNLFVDKAINDEVEVKINDVFTNAADLASLLGVEKEVAEALESNFKIVIKKVTERKEAELTEENLAKIAPNSEIKTEEEYIEYIKNNIKTSLNEESKFKLYYDIREKFVKKADIKLPEAFLKRWILSMNDKLTSEEYDKNLKNYHDSFKWQLITAKLADENSIEVSKEDVFEYTKQKIKIQLAQYGMPMNDDNPMLDEWTVKQLEDQNTYSENANSVGEDKICQFIAEKIKLEDKEVSSEEFSDILKEMQENK
ncbi:MAG: trigger factor [Marinifilaceae bacterium]|jgi:trigger factor|nr:trigger factor [Marinifilaceae bacterium]